MQSTDLDVIKKAKQWLDNSKAIWLCTITGTYGSAPRPIGSLFATDGIDRAGSISGGCLEDAFIEQLNQGLFNQSAQLFTYGDHAKNTSQAVELPCGGTIRLLVEYFPVDEPSQTHLQSWLTHIDSHQPFQRQVQLINNSKSFSQTNDSTKQDVIVAADQVTLNYAQIWSILILGIGTVSDYVAQLALMAGYQVKVCDIREELSASWHLNNPKVEWISPDIFVDRHANNRSAILGLAHDPRIDDLGLMAAFESDAFYIGAMGSIRTSEKRRERLKRVCELSENQLARLHAPIGLNIGSKTPMEIAIAIMADITRVKHGVALSAISQ